MKTAGEVKLSLRGGVSTRARTHAAHARCTEAYLTRDSRPVVLHEGRNALSRERHAGQVQVLFQPELPAGSTRERGRGQRDSVRMRVTEEQRARATRRAGMCPLRHAERAYARACV
jgi:hypothetical protein